jgi:hypothetical protein
MDLKIDVFYRNKKTGKFQILHETITEKDIDEIAREKTKDNLPMWMDENWEFNSADVDKIEMQ